MMFGKLPTVECNMDVKAVCSLLVLLPAVVLSAKRGATCTTPNGESAKCTSFEGCTVIKTAVVTQNRDAIEFAKLSQCGYDTEPLVCCGSSGYPAQTNLSPLLPDMTKCGTTKGNRITGGEKTELWEFPWMVLLGYKNSDGSDAGFKCGGTVISKRYILTAAHCVAISSNLGYNVNFARLGEWKVSSEQDCEEGLDLANEECADPVVDLLVEKKIVHPEYNRRSGKNDIALLRVESDIEFTDYIRAICLPRPGSAYPVTGTTLTVVGWGQTENSSESDYKLKVQVPVVSRTACSAKIRQRGEIGENQVCAGGVLKKDSCQGDSGGPLMGYFPSNFEQEEQWYQEGVVSWGIGCGIIGYPAVYTRVSMYVKWIVDNLSP